MFNIIGSSLSLPTSGGLFGTILAMGPSISSIVSHASGELSSHPQRRR